MAESLIKKVEGENFKDVISSGVTLVDFFAEWCAPCRMLEPILNELAEKLKGKVTIAQLDIDQAQQIAEEYQVTSVPTLILYKSGQEKDRIVGLKDSDALFEFISSVTG